LLPRVPNRRLWRVFKRAFDVGFSALVLLMTAPLYPIIMLAIWLEDGWPPFFAHTRQTIDGRSFPCYKFRTMCKNAEQIKAKLVAANVCDGPQFFIADDPRLLRVGKLLRRVQLDEIPQFYNVLVGHMSLVGPRPSPDKENQFCPAWREARLSVRPGITGLWQVRRTRVPQTDFQEWIRYDLEYVQHASWRLDLWILMLTIKKVISG
jgi:lipopolysaccharide/colanic/teichoic acid biosynthesis glycosyltransferase